MVSTIDPCIELPRPLPGIGAAIANHRGAGQWTHNILPLIPGAIFSVCSSNIHS